MSEPEVFQLIDSPPASTQPRPSLVLANELVADIDLAAGTVADLVADERFARLLARSLVFVQDRRWPAERLLAVMGRRVESLGMNIKCIDASKDDLDDLRAKLVAPRHGRRTALATFVLDATGAMQRLSELLESVPSAYPRTVGMWVRARVCELPLHLIQRGDIVFLFDMARDELEQMRTALPLSDSHVQALHAGGPEGTEHVLVFTARDPNDDLSLPRLENNPSLVMLRRREEQAVVDIDPFVPVIAASVDFVLDSQSWTVLPTPRSVSATNPSPRSRIELVQAMRRRDYKLVRRVQFDAMLTSEKQLRTATYGMRFLKSRIERRVRRGKLSDQLLVNMNTTDVQMLAAHQATIIDVLAGLMLPPYGTGALGRN